METKEKLTRLREQNRISQSELAERLNVSRQAISRWEGGRTSPTVDTLKVLAKIYGVTVDWLLNDEETEFPQRKDETGGQVQKTGTKDWTKEKEQSDCYGYSDTFSAAWLGGVVHKRKAKAREWRKDIWTDDNRYSRGQHNR